MAKTEQEETESLNDMFCSLPGDVRRIVFLLSPAHSKTFPTREELLAETQAHMLDVDLDSILAELLKLGVIEVTTKLARIEETITRLDHVDPKKVGMLGEGGKPSAEQIIFLKAKSDRKSAERNPEIAKEWRVEQFKLTREFLRYTRRLTKRPR